MASSKQHYKLADVCRMLEIQPYVLRYWQTEFPALASKKSGGWRSYDTESLEVVRRIKELLYDEGYTIDSAKEKLAAELEEGNLRGRPLTMKPSDDDDREPANGGEPPVADARGDDPEANADEPEAAAEHDDAAEEPGPLAGGDREGAADRPAVPEAGETGDLEILARRVERLEGGVAELVSQARQLAAELKPEPGGEGAPESRLSE